MICNDYSPIIALLIFLEDVPHTELRRRPLLSWPRVSNRADQAIGDSSRRSQCVIQGCYRNEPTSTIELAEGACQQHGWEERGEALQSAIVGAVLHTS